MDVKQLEYLVEIEEQGSISKAAEKLYISQSALSQCLSKHEKELNEKLFKRSGNTLVPTEVGSIYLDGAKKMINVKNEVYKNLSNIANTGKKKYSIACDFLTYSVFMEIVIPEMKKIYPDIYFEVNRVNSNLAKQYLKNNISDIAIMCVDRKSNSLFEYLPLYEDELVFCIPKSIKKYSNTYPVILLENGTLFRSIQDKLILNSQITPNKIFEVEDFFTAKHLMTKQYGVTYLPKKLVEQSKEYNFHSLKPAYSFNIVFSYYKYIDLNSELKMLYNLLIKSFNE